MPVTTLKPLGELKVGDKVTRMLDGQVFMVLLVDEVKFDRYVCALWEFDKQWGMEMDDLLKWGPMYGQTGTYIIAGATDGARAFNPNAEGSIPSTGSTEAKMT